MAALNGSELIIEAEGRGQVRMHIRCDATRFVQVFGI